MSAPPGEVRREEPLAPHTSAKVGGAADLFAQPRSADEIAALLRWARASGVPARVIGGGTNLLVSDAGVEGLVIKPGTSRTAVVEQDGQPVLVADAAVTFANVARRMARMGYGGLEWATNVPGTMGGAAVNNAGAFGGETRSDLAGVVLLDCEGNVRRLASEEMGYGYRTSALKRLELGTVAVLQVEMRLKLSTPARAQALVREYQRQRTETQPRQLSMGSVFANPVDAYAGKLVEEAGLKGLSLGGARISALHANFIVNTGGATARDVYQLVRMAQDAVYAGSGTWLLPEVELLGRWTAAERDALARPRTTRGTPAER